MSTFKNLHFISTNKHLKKVMLSYATQFSDWSESSCSFKEISSSWILKRHAFKTTHFLTEREELDDKS